MVGGLHSPVLNSATGVPSETKAAKYQQQLPPPAGGGVSPSTKVAVAAVISTSSVNFS